MIVAMAIALGNGSAVSQCSKSVTGYLASPPSIDKYLERGEGTVELDRALV